MTTYTVRQHTPRKRRGLSRRIPILSVTFFLLFISLFVVVRPPAQAAAKPIYATIKYVDHAISTALSPIQNAIASLQTQQASQGTQISNLQAKTAQPLSIFSGSLSNGQESAIFDTNGHSIMFLSANWDSGQGGFHILYSADQQTWLEQGSGISSFVANGSVPPQSTAIVTQARYYKFTVANSFNGQLTGFMY
jgi:hypothetical protein